MDYFENCETFIKDIKDITNKVETKPASLGETLIIVIAIIVLFIIILR